MKLIFLHRQGDKVTFFNSIRTVVFGGIFILCLPGTLSAQILFEQTAPKRYYIEFTDKNNNPYSLSDPGAFLSEKAIARRNNQKIPLAENDLPVTRAYIDSIRATGARIVNVSKWFNAVTVEAESDSILNRIAKYTFVKKGGSMKSGFLNVHQLSGGIQSIDTAREFDYGVSGWQTAIHKGNILHNLGYTGKGIIIAQLDAGFYHVDRKAAFSSLWLNHQILGTHDFVIPGSNVFEGHLHGMVVLSIMAGNLPGQLIGSAPDASFWLLRTEDTGSEYPIEEDNWASGAEFADSAGADVINTSLGYSQFDDESMNLSYSDMNGNTARITRAADIASSKGMVVVTSAGNLGAAGWHYISAPADADSVLAVGAIEANGNIAEFSSRGPTSDLRIKPDVVGVGKGTWMADFTTDTVRQGNGTSLSSPVIAGLVACLWQANRSATARQIVNAVKESSDRFSRPDNDYGYGIPDFSLAHVLLSREEPGSPLQGKMLVYPNPFRSELYLFFPDPVNDEVDVTLFDLTGKEVFHSVIPAFPERKYITIDFDHIGLSTGVYILKTVTGGRNDVSKIIRF
jgi:serine protease AprX